MNLLSIFVIVGLLYLIFVKRESIAHFVTFAPPTLPKKTPHWDHTFATKANLRQDVAHADVLVNYFPMMKPPATLERAQEQNIDIARSQFVPRMAKRGVTVG